MTHPAHGPINQTAYIVADIDSGIDYWTRVMRVGPFFKFPKLEFQSADYRGQALDLDFDAAIAYSGELMIELIRPRGPSIFREFADGGRTGVQHIGAFADDMAAASASLEQRGGRRVQGGSFADGSRIAYFDMGGRESLIFEVAQLMPPVQQLFGAVKAAGAVWDGVTPTLSLG
jgi:hypothetical protein